MSSPAASPPQTPRHIAAVIIHCSATPNDRTLFSRGSSGVQRTPVQIVNDWHVDRGFHRSPEWRARFNPRLDAIGYHYVIYRNGAIATGRHEGEVGAHCRGFNRASIGICVLGTDAFAAAQWASLATLCRSLGKSYPAARLVGHRDVPGVSKTCPGFSVRDWIAGGMIPLAGHVWS